MNLNYTTGTYDNVAFSFNFYNFQTIYNNLTYEQIKQIQDITEIAYKLAMEKESA